MNHRNKPAEELVGAGWYWNREGKRVTLRRWAELTEERAYKRIAETTLPSGRWISTVWLGLDHSFGMDGGPLIFETMITDPGEAPRVWLDYQERYSTEAEALVGHDVAVAWAIADEQSRGATTAGS